MTLEENLQTQFVALLRAALAVVVLALLCLAASCNQPTDMLDTNGQPIKASGYNMEAYSRPVLLKDGRVVQCVFTTHGAIACDFEHTKPASIPPAELPK